MNLHTVVTEKEYKGSLVRYCPPKLYRNNHNIDLPQCVKDCRVACFSIASFRRSISQGAAQKTARAKIKKGGERNFFAHGFQPCALTN